VEKIAVKKLKTGHKLSGILVKLVLGDLPKYTDLVMISVTQRQSISYTGSTENQEGELVILEWIVCVL
uniref:Uncharacterized protein n=1 Tax=Strigamia maritima TaxID=126957 RepID=T1J6B2_STRMM